MPRFPDISEYFAVGNRALIEEVNSLLTGQYKRHLEFLLPKIEENHVKTVIEWGCGSGLLAPEVSKLCNYVGIDRNQQFLSMARRRCPESEFLDDDIRTTGHEGAHLSMAWSFLKHFNLAEWDSIFRIILNSGKFAAFNVQILGQDLDNGTDYHHVYVTEDRLKHGLEYAGHDECSRQVLWEGELRDHGVMKDVMIWTRRRV